MTAINRDQLETLVELQRIESEKKEVQTVLDDVAQKIARLDREVLETANEIAEKRSQIEKLKENYQELETKVQDNDTLIQKIEAKRRSVQTEKEYQSMLKEEEQLRALKAQMEDEMINCMDQTETTEKVLAEKEIEHKALCERVESEKQMIRQDASDSEKKNLDLKSRWDDVAARTQPRLLRTFNQIKALTPMGNAVVSARDSICGGCHMNIPPQMYNELQRFDSLKLCPFCNRILYWESD